MSARDPACAWFHASRRCARTRAEASTGDSFATPSAPQGSSAAVRSTREFDSQDFVDEISREGMSAPSSRAKTPTTVSGAGFHGQADAAAFALRGVGQVEEGWQRGP